MAKNRNRKRKASPIEASTAEPLESSIEENEEIEIGEEVVDGNDSSDSEGEEVYTSDDEGELSFESDEEGNFSRNLNKMKLNGGGEDSSGEDENADAEKEEPSSSNTAKKEKLQTSVEAFKSELNGSSSKKNQQEEEDEYKNDTSDEEDIRNTVGNIPMHWYDEYKHIGYDWDAKKIIKPARRDQLDDFLKRMEDPNFWRTVKDKQTGQDIVISEADIELIKRINSQRIPDEQYNDYAPWVEWFTSEVEQMPITNVPAHKRSFLPSKSEKTKVAKLVHAIKMGWMKTTEQREKEKAAAGPKFYMLWESDTDREKMRRIHDHVSAPKRDLPGHAESYNPPPEYLFDDKEMKEWHKFKDEPQRRKLHFMPQKFNSLREVPAYSRYIRERFLRCLDLYLCPRAKRMKLTIDAEYLIPKLPSPKDLQPFPTVESIVYTGHTDMIRTISIEPYGQYIVSGSDDHTVKIWEVSTGRCTKTIDTGDIVRSVAWCPNSKISLIAVASGQRLILLNPKVGDKMLIKKTDDILIEAPKIDVLESERIKSAVQWAAAEGNEYETGYRIIITHFKPIKQVTWHGKGDYFATVMPEGANRSALIHQLSKRRTQIPFSKSKGLIQCVLFHPIKPCLFVATQKNIRIYDLVKQELLKKLLSNSKWISDMAIHPKGDNLLVSTYDKKMLWFDLDLSTKPYQTIRLHRNAVRSSAYHLRYPLFASASDDQSVIVSHGMVYNDLLQNPLIVPLKKLQTHKPHEDFGVFDVMWHPAQPWVFSAGADSTIRLYT
ncbi:Ribosome biogenesis protein BOP1 like [Pseudolycoriella hygida]|uniref:Ribosome biogenesis protein BOP1 homolog n=1 Tax=Pseudolycoriella hygida TaxID=35572 RepID=A0A9Q0N5M8_9DIPT|nr:Ribosome biogenesis protein BOP1 like [Pseudolycoriella hygida]